MTIKEIAEMAGVSNAAVSRYFNNGYLSEAKRSAIEKVVKETGFQPSASAAMLRTKKTKTIGVILPRVYSYSMGMVVAGISDVLDKNGYRMLFADTQNHMERELEYLRIFDEKQVDGIILSGTIFTPEHRRLLKKQSVPIVIVGQQLKGYNCIYHDDYHAEYALTKYFIEKGKRKIGYIGVTENDHAVGELRRKGFCDACRDHHLEECCNNYVISSFTLEGGTEKMGELYTGHPDLDSVICATDRIAAGALIWLRQHKVDVPGKIEIAGQGDTDIARISYPPISTIHYYYEESGVTAAERLLELLRAKEAEASLPVQEMMLGYEIIDRLI